VGALEEGLSPCAATMLLILRGQSALTESQDFYTCIATNYLQLLIHGMCCCRPPLSWKGQREKKWYWMYFKSLKQKVWKSWRPESFPLAMYTHAAGDPSFNSRKCSFSSVKDWMWQSWQQDMGTSLYISFSCLLLALTGTIYCTHVGPEISKVFATP